MEEISKEPRLKSIAFPLVGAFYRTILVEAVLMAGITLLYATRSLLNRLLRDPTNTTEENYPLPFPERFPWSLESPPIWYLHYAFEFNVCYYIIFVSSGVDAFYGFTMFRMSSVLRRLTLQFEILSARKDDEIRRKEFGECIEMHVALFKCRDIIQEVYGPVVLIVATTNALCMCSLIFQIVQVNTEISNAQMAIYTTYFVMKFTQTLMYAWPGSVIISESELFRDKIYCSYWYKNGDANLIKQFSLILTQRTIVVKACRILLVSLDLFVKVLNTAISYYFLLKTIDGGK
ncbi:odorant receptor 82a [Megachile rotundata]|uniref:odorant receptor 82a n=1 Tax=Megachile rotundata TaxID=143995 RepID=UPI000614EE6A|nr:PREDICTED: odorant receptor Or2-like [Megachile rotundata]